MPNQTFSLKLFPLVARTFQIQVKEKIDNDYYWRDWIRVDDFDASRSEDPHYVLDPQQGEIYFGDGVNGKIPPVPDYKSEYNIRVISCQLVRGEQGNVEAKTIKEICHPVSGLLDKEFVTVANSKAAIGGTAHESIEQAKWRARKELKQIDRAVTSEDFEQLTLATPGLRIARAKAILTQGEEPSSLVKVVVVPYSETSDGVTTYLDVRQGRLLGLAIALSDLSQILMYKTSKADFFVMRSLYMGSIFSAAARLKSLPCLPYKLLVTPSAF